MPVTVPAVVLNPPVVVRRPNMTKQFLILFMAIMIIMVAFVYELGTLAVTSDEIRMERHAVQDGTWVDASVPYKLPEKKHFWTLP